MSLNSWFHSFKAAHPNFWDWFKFAAFTGGPAWAITSVLNAYIKNMTLADWTVAYIVISGAGDILRYGLVRLFRVNRRRTLPTGGPLNSPGLGLVLGADLDQLEGPLVLDSVPVDIELRLGVVSD